MASFLTRGFGQSARKAESRLADFISKGKILTSVLLIKLKRAFAI